MAGPPGPAQAGAEKERSGGSTPRALVRGILLPALIATLNGVAFVAVYTAAFHDPVAHDLPVAVVGSDQQAEQAQQQLDRSASGQFEVRRYAAPGPAGEALTSHDVYGVLDLTATPARLQVAGANGQQVTQLVQQALSPLTQASGQPPQVQDVRPLVAGDSRGLALFYAAFGVVLGGFLFGISSFSSAPKLLLRYRVLSIVLFAVLAGSIIGWLADVVYAALPAGFLLVSSIVALLATACGATAAVLFRLVGSAGQILTSIGLVIIGNATSTGTLPAQFLPPWMEPLAHVLPSGVAVRALRGATYFDDDGVRYAWIVLGLWTVVPLLLIGGLDALQRRRQHAGRHEPGTDDDRPVPELVGGRADPA
ncbi:ABC transporter permease [Modestobacter sp. NPDC049651]|uniref:ABC transporter permease n=1 Tax=unclassified Modestobacter TaxID=2643866 RepID=UPI0033DCB4AA